jgi:hypothetical protein
MNTHFSAIIIRTISRILLGIFLFMYSFGFIFIYTAHASSLTSLSDIVSTQSASANTDSTISFTTPTGVASGETIILTFSSSSTAPTINASLTYTDIDVLDDGVNITLAGTPSGATAGVVRTSATVITFTNGTTAISAGSVITFKIGTNATNQSTGVYGITNGTAGTMYVAVSGSFGDTGVMSIPIISNSAVTISATVDETLSFSISDSTIYFGNLSPSFACFAQGTDPGAVTCPSTSEIDAFSMTAQTNSTTGYTVTVQGATLTSGVNTITALPANTNSSAGSEQFGMRFTHSGGSGAVTSPYAASGYAYTATASSAVEVASSTVATTTDTYSARYIANISSVTEAGSYSTTQTFVATANF